MSKRFLYILFIAAGISQAVISRFFLPGFVPNIYNPANIAAMILLPLAIVIIFLIGFRQILSLKKNLQLVSLQSLFLFTSFVFIPYFLASLARSATGALGSLAERYIYFPFFFFILAGTVVYHYLNQKLSHQFIFHNIFIGFITILSIGHQITLFFAANELFVR